MFTEGAVVWQPSQEYTSGSHLERLIKALKLDSYDALYKYSVDHPDQFWKYTLDLLGIEWFKPYEKFVDYSKGKAWPDWFVGGEINFVHNCLRRAFNPETKDRIAISWEGEEGSARELSYETLANEVGRFATVLKNFGIKKGDRVSIYMPMVPETVIAYLAIPLIGAIVVPIFSGFGTEAVATRTRDAEARLLITVDGYTRRAKPVRAKNVVDEIAASCSSLEKVIVVKRLGEPVNMEPGRDYAWEDLMMQTTEVCPILPMDPNDPYMIIYTSGTTGKPKGMLHTHTGFPLKCTQDAAHLFDLREGEALFWMSDLGWMLGPLMIIASLTLGSTLVLFDGAPDYPDWGRVGRIIEKHKVTHFGGAPTLMRGMAAQSDKLKDFDRSSLRGLVSSGEMWDPDTYMWFFNEFGRGKLPIINYSGGTEISGGIFGNVIYRPIKVAAFNTVVPGIKAAVVDDDGNPVLEQIGELVVQQPFVGMTRGFWQEPERYIETYWSRFEDIWVHGDLAFEDKEGHFFILGRSDDTLKVAGKRLGPGEVEAIATEHPGVVEAAAIGVPHPKKGEELVVFVVPLPGSDNENLDQEVSKLIEQRLGKSFKPGKVYVVKELPKTRTSKVMRRVIRKVYQGQAPGDLTMLENPTAVEVIKKLGGN